MARVSVNARRAYKKLNAAKAKIDHASKASVMTLAKAGMYKAKSIAPHYSGYTAKLIRTRTKKLNDGYESVVLSPNSTRNDGHVRRISRFNLVRWMHTSGKAQKHIKSGNRQYMYETARWLRTQSGRVAKGQFNKIKFN